jgi:hypothetical protein
MRLTKNRPATDALDMPDLLDAHNLLSISNYNTLMIIAIIAHKVF